MNNTQENKFVELIGKIPNIAVQGYNKEREVIYWNNASEIIYGYTEDEAFGKKIEDLIIPDFMVKDVIFHHKNWYEKNIPIPSGELPLINKNKQTVYVYSSHVMLNENSDNPEMFCIDIDLTEQKSQKEELEDKNKVLAHQSKMAALGEMFENIAHQWRQPLSIISISASEIKLKEELQILDKEYLKSSVDSILDTTMYLSQTIEDFRDFINNTHEEITFDLFSTIKHSLKLLDSVIKKENIEIVLSTTIYDIEMLGYPNELIQVLINLITNCKDAFTERNIEKRFIFIDLRTESDKVIIRVKDNANGIDEDIISRIFELYFTTKFKSQGTGVGLYMSYKLITKSMNGTIEVENRKYTYEQTDYKGTEFTIKLPHNL